MVGEGAWGAKSLRDLTGQSIRMAAEAVPAVFGADLVKRSGF